MGKKKSSSKKENLTGGKRARTPARAKRPRSELTELQERFCVKYSEQGFCNAAGALEAAGSRAGYASRCSLASKWLRRDKVKARLRLLSKKADKRAQNRDEKAVASLAERKARLSEIVRATSGQLRGISLEGGKLVFDDEAVRSAVKAKAQIVMVQNEDYDRDDPASSKKVPAVLVDLSLHDPIKAIQELNRMDGVYKEGSLVPAEIHLHTGSKQPLELDEQTAAQINDASLRVPLQGSKADQARFKKAGAGKDPFKALATKKAGKVSGE